MVKNHYKKYRKKSNILLTCEHASKRIPREFKRLGLKRKELENSKDWYDPGAFEVMKFLAEKLKTSCIYSDVSRLVIDYNRRLNGKNKNKDKFHSCPMKYELLVGKNGKDDIVKIPGNNFSTEKKFLAEEKKRFKKYVVPYRKDGYLMIDRIKNVHKMAYVILIHSFYPFYNGDKRNVDIGVLHFSKQTFSERVIKSLKKNTKFKIGNNKPWKLSDADGSIFHRVEDMKNAELLVFDINNKNLINKKDIKKISVAIAEALKENIF
ncbi:MAG: N-formylglutamate amidohydrolase [Candidatus Moranbacteria bacterium]|nr:N-formylglutamate amidohydrolase [Candidatus Moranbacteria bacterium]